MTDVTGTAKRIIASVEQVVIGKRQENAESGLRAGLAWPLARAYHPGTTLPPA